MEVAVSNVRFSREPSVIDELDVWRHTTLAPNNGKWRLFRQAMSWLPPKTKRGPEGPRLPISVVALLSGLLFEHRPAPRLADIVDVGLHFLRRRLAEQADDVDHRESERRSQHPAGDVGQA